MLRLVARLLRVLNSESEPGQISLAFCFAMVAGLTPLLSLHNVLVFFLVLVLRVNLSAFILAFIFFSGLAFILDPIFHVIGLGLLTASPLEWLWTVMYNSTLWRVEKFNNSVVMGSLFFSLVLFAPAYFIFNSLILRYRESVLEWVRKTHLMQAFKASRLYKLYSSYSELRGSV